jgi:hypothetical protein
MRFLPNSELRPLPLLRLAACCLLGPACAAQHNARDLSGTVSDAHHEPLRGAVVQVHGEAFGTVVSYITDRSGRYTFKRLEDDLDYTVWATWNGKRSAVKKLSLFDTSTAKVIDLEVIPDR